MKKIISLIILSVISLSITSPVFAERDWEYWSRYSFEAPLNKQISYLIKPEWRIKDDMTDKYLFKLEQAIAVKINQFLEIAPYYVWQESKTGGNVDRSDLIYFDTTAKIPLKEFFDLKIIDRFRYQYNFDKELTVFRNSTRLTKSFKIKNLELSPFIEDEIFYDTKLDKLNENWASAGVSLALNKYANIGMSYLLDTKKKGDDWVYANVLVTSLSLKF
jgi:hypothetical protein